MTYQEALDQIDMPTNKDNCYSKRMMVSQSNRKFIGKGFYGLYVCTHDWPVPFHPSEKDLAATDYRIVASTGDSLYP